MSQIRKHLHRHAFWLVVLILVVVGSCAWGGVTLIWDEVSDPRLTEYRMYRCTGALDCPTVFYRSAGLTLSFTDGAPIPGQHHRYQVTAAGIDPTRGPIESAKSNIATFDAPAAATDCTTDGLVGRWEFSDGPGSTTAQDSSGQGNHGTLTNMDPATDWVMGHRGYALDFDGHGAQVITLYTGTPIQSTWTAWAFPRTYGQHKIGGLAKKTGVGDIAIEADGPGAADRAWSLIRAFSGGQAFWMTPTDSVLLNQWQHLAVVYDSASALNDPIIYINGVAQPLIKEGSHGGSALTNSHPWIIGQGFGTASTFDGMIDEIRFYDRLLTAEEIQCLANIGQPPIAPGATTIHFRAP